MDAARSACTSNQRAVVADFEDRRLFPLRNCCEGEARSLISRTASDNFTISLACNECEYKYIVSRDKLSYKKAFTQKFN